MRPDRLQELVVLFIPVLIDAQTNLIQLSILTGSDIIFKDLVALVSGHIKKLCLTNCATALVPMAKIAAASGSNLALTYA